MRPSVFRSGWLGIASVGGAFLLLTACGTESRVTAPPSVVAASPAEVLTQLTCVASVHDLTVHCGSPVTAGATATYADIFGGQGINVTLASSNFTYNAVTRLFQFDVTVQNLLNEALGTPNGVFVDTAGVKVFFFTQPTVTVGIGAITILNADGTGTFNGANQPFYRYPGIVATNLVSAPKTWQFDVPPTVAQFTFTVYLAATVQTLLVINEVLVNPGGTISDANGEWFEIYNAGSRSVDLQGLILRDSAASGTRPPHGITASVVVPPGGYAVVGNTTNTTNNGGVPVDYAYGATLFLANSVDRVKIERQFGADTVVIDEVRYASAAISGQNGISRELTNPLLDNFDMDGPNWADALVTAVYGPGGRGTPKAQNSTFVP